jgi:hypothetical protein
VIELPVGYEDSLRRTVISRFVATLLPCYGAVVRVDVDEFLVIDPQVSTSLADYIATMTEPYATARGFDVIQLPGEPVLEQVLTQPLLSYRSHAYPNTALNKTCIVKTPVEWSAGFHWANVYPSLGPLFMLHMKRVDIEWQMLWYKGMHDSIKDDPKVDHAIKEYYFPDRQKIEQYHRGVSQRHRVAGVENWYRTEATAAYMAKIKLSTVDKLYRGDYGHENVLCEIPAEWKALI